MLRIAWLLLTAAALAARSGAQSQSNSSSTLSSSSTSTSTSTSNDAAFSFTQTVSYITTSLPTSGFTGGNYTYISYTGQRTVSSDLSSTTASNVSSTSTDSRITRSTTADYGTTLVGSIPTSNTVSGSASSTSSSAAPTNTVPCNNYPEFCNRKYSNITQVCAHNSAFAVKNNVASNQVLDITTQLNDGIRMLQGETHYYMNDIYNCHTSCNLLNAGTWESSLATLVTWLENHPYDVVTWLIVNSDFVDVENYVAPIENSGIRQYLYEPKYIPQHRDQWPTLGQMILSGKRVVMFMDYNANQTAVPYILDEFSHMWETPFSPTNQSFPCTQQRPPNLNQTTARDEYMYLANHNLNVAISVDALLGTTGQEPILIPDTSQINQTNGEYNQFGQLAAMSLNCTNDWSRPPNFLLVDYYNFGDPKPGSVFEVAAEMNGVTYTRSCCGTVSPAPIVKSSMFALVAAIGLAFLLHV